MGRSRIIEGAQNPVLKELRAALTPRGIQRHRRAVVSGDRVVAEAIRLAPERCAGWVTSEASHPPPAAIAGRVVWFQLAPALFLDLDVFGIRRPLLVVDAPPFPRWTPDAGLEPGLSLLLPLQDPENLGAALRSARAFGVDRVILLEEAVTPYHPKAIRASAGTVFGLPLLDGPSVAALPADLPVIPLSGGGRDIETVDVPDPGAVLVGLEGPGLPEPWRSQAVTIPIDPGVESLNAAAAVAVALYALRRRSGRPA